MKYIITENKINDLIFQFLDSYEWLAWDYSDDEISVYDKSSRKRMFYTEVFNVPPDVDETEYSLHINHDFYKNRLYNMFGEVLNPWTIVTWFNDKFNTNCVSFDYFELDSDEEENN